MAGASHLSRGGKKWQMKGRGEENRERNELIYGKMRFILSVFYTQVSKHIQYGPQLV